MEKASRNDPCPCGSGKKFKKCCESQKKTRTFQVISSEARVQGISSLLFKKPSTEKEISPEVEKK
ncbi:MAG: SEC-C metal-binding domain-containing protein [Chlamydiota bacterium]